MRVLLTIDVSSPGGSGKVFLSETDLLLENGHEVAHFGCNLENYKTATIYNAFAADESGSSGSSKNVFARLFSKLRVNILKIVNMFYGPHLNAKYLETAIKDFKPDIIHSHGIINIFIQPEFCKVAKKYNVPLIVTCHETLVVCPSGFLLKGGVKGEQCDAICSKESILGLSSILHGCREGLVSTIWNFYRFNRRIRKRTLEKYVDLVLTPSKALYNQVVNSKQVPAERVKYSRYPLVVKQIDSPQKTSSNPYFIFIGRLVEEKGIQILLDVFEELPEVPLVVLGSGPLAEDVQKRIKDTPLKNVQSLGWKSGRELGDYIQNALATIVPSIWFENAALSVSDSYEYGRPVLVANFGGASENVIDGETGFVHAPCDKEKLKEQILKLWNDPKLAEEYGYKGNQFLMQFYTKELAYQRMLDAYEAARQNHNQLNLK